MSAGPLSRWLRSQWQAVVWSGTNKFFTVHNCYYCQPRGQFGSRKAQVSDGKFWHFNWQHNQPAAEQPWTVRWTLMPVYIPFALLAFSLILLIFWWNPQTWTLATSCHHCIFFRPSWPKKALKGPRWGQRGIWGWLTWHGWNFCGMQRWLLFRQKIGDFVPLESVEREVIRWCDNH